MILKYKLDKMTSYYNNEGKYQKLYEELMDKCPPFKPSKNEDVERVRQLSKIIDRFLNDGELPYDCDCKDYVDYCWFCTDNGVKTCYYHHSEEHCKHTMKEYGEWDEFGFSWTFDEDEAGEHLDDLMDELLESIQTETEVVSIKKNKEITKEDFIAYKIVQESGKYNMLSFEAEKATNLPVEKYFKIIQNYTELSKLFK